VEPRLAYHVTQRGTNREQVFFTIGDYKLCLELNRQRSCAGSGYCLMRNHVHVVVVL
jgi:REP element-mobilizing transposase RayT